MRTTINIDDELYEIVRSVAHQNKCALGATIQKLVERGLRQEVTGSSGTAAGVDELTGFPLFSSRRLVSEEDVRSLEDDV
jgi:hypothetical protein